MRRLAGVFVFVLLLCPASVAARIVICEDNCTPPPPPKGASILFIPGTEASRLYTKNADGSERELWEPSTHADIPLLSFNPDGTSAKQIYTRDIIGSLYGNDVAKSTLLATFLSKNDVEVYAGLESYLNGLAQSGTIKEWRAFPYDWRYDPVDIANNGTLVATSSDAEPRTVTLEDVVDDMASSSYTGTVMIVAHSNGGLVAKAFLQKLAAEGKSNLIDQVVLIGTPQFGTPSAIGALLHGDNVSDLPRFIVHAEDFRAAASTLPDSYALLPSATYFTNSTSSVINFATSTLTQNYQDAYGAHITDQDTLTRFLTDDAHVNGDTSDLHNPLTLTTDLLASAGETHNALDTWNSSVPVTVIAGTGLRTPRGLSYTTATTEHCTTSFLIFSNCTTISYLSHAPLTTTKGDEEVVSGSAAGNTSALYLDLAAYNKAGHSIAHQNLTSADPIQGLIGAKLLHNFFVSPYITQPTGASASTTVVSTHSPVHLIVEDSAGNKSGVVPLPGDDFSYTLEQIPESSVEVEGDEEYVYLPTNDSYRITLTGYAEGVTRFETADVSDEGEASTTAMYYLPTSASSTAQFTVIDGTADPILSVDLDGDGASDATTSEGELLPLAVPAPSPATSSPPESPPPTSGGAAILAFNQNPIPETVTSTTTSPIASSMPVTASSSTSTLSIASSTPHRFKISPAPKIATATSVPQTAAALAGARADVISHWWNALLAFLF